MFSHSQAVWITEVKLVVPDFENLCCSHLFHSYCGQHEWTDLLVFALLDHQCVRGETGGELGRFYQKRRSACQSNTKVIDLVSHRTGEDLMLPAQ